MTARVTLARPAGPDHQVVTLEGDGSRAYRRRPCGGCPWLTANDGLFPAEAFRHSARTAYDMAHETFACHETGKDKPAVCAGFLLRGADNNLGARLMWREGLGLDCTDGGQDLHENYRAMAEANGVDPQDPVLGPCR